MRSVELTEREAGKVRTVLKNMIKWNAEAKSEKNEWAHKLIDRENAILAQVERKLRKNKGKK